MSLEDRSERDVPDLERTPDAAAPTPADLDADLDGRVLLASIESLSEELTEETREIGVGSVATLGVSTALSVGYVIWSIRGSHLATSILASTPAWSGIDPLPIISFVDAKGKTGRRKRQGQEAEPQDAVESLFQAESRVVF